MIHLVLFLVFDCCLLFLITIDVNTRCNAHTKLNVLLLLLLSYYGTCFYNSELYKRIPNPCQSVAERWCQYKRMGHGRSFMT